MSRLTLGERLDRLAKRRARDAQEEAKLKALARKQRTRQLIEIGGLAAKAGIDALSARALYACFLRIAADAKDPATVARWDREGGRHFQAEDEAREVAVARFPDKVPPEAAAALRKLGFRWNRLLDQWEGKVVLAEARPVVEASGGVIAPAKPDGATVQGAPGRSGPVVRG